MSKWLGRLRSSSRGVERGKGGARGEAGYDRIRV
jgi:hypothetical protein